MKTSKLVIESNLENPLLINNKFYHLKSNHVEWKGKKFYIATHGTKKLNFIQKIGCACIGIFLALISKKIDSFVWLYKADYGKDAIGVVIKPNAENPSPGQIQRLIKKRQMNDLFEQACKYRDGIEGAPNLPLAKKWFGLALKKNHPQATAEWKKVTTSLILNSGSENGVLEWAAFTCSKEIYKIFKDAYKNSILNLSSPYIAKIGGTLLATAENSTEFYCKTMPFNPKMQETLEKHHSELSTHLQIKGLIPKTEKVETEIPNGGICKGMVMDFFSQVNAIPMDENFESSLIKIAKKYEYHSKTKAIALQSVYEQALDIMPEVEEDLSYKNKKWNKKKRQGLSKTKKISEILYQSLKQKVVFLPHMGIVGSHKDKDYLKKWLKEPDGNYDMGIETSEGRHALALVKRGGVIYLWDPNFGLIKCLGNPKYPWTNKFHKLIGFSPIHKISKFLYSNYGKTSNHCIEINRIEPV